MSILHWLIAVTSLLCCSAAWRFTQRRKGWPRNSFLYNPECKYTDLTVSICAARRDKPYEPIIEGLYTPYFPFLIWIFRLGAVGCMRVCYLALVALLTWWWGWAAAVVLLVSYPAMFADNRGNVDHIIGAWSGLSVALLLGGHPMVGALMLACAIAAKGYPAALALLWLGHSWSLTAMAALSASLVLVPARGLGGGIRESLAGLRRGNRAFYEWGILARNGPAFCTSHYCCDLFSALRLLHWWRGKDFDAERWFRPCVSIATFWATWLTLIAWSSPHTWVKVMALGMVQVVFPHVANDYKLMALAPGIILWLLAGAPGLLLGACLLLLWVPKAYWYPRPERTWASISCAINPLLTIGATIGLWMGRF